MKIIITSLILISLTIFLIFKEDPKNDSIALIDAKKEVLVKKLKKKKFVNKLKFSGYTEASRIVIIKSQVEGKIASKTFEKGKFYKAGTQLIKGETIV